MESELHIIKLLADRKEYYKIIEFADNIQVDMDELYHLELPMTI